jgi:hypothetical protein
MSTRKTTLVYAVSHRLCGPWHDHRRSPVRHERRPRPGADLRVAADETGAPITRGGRRTSTFPLHREVPVTDGSSTYQTRT